ncbi:MAG: hypothetical protein LBI92_04190 [Azoarcus sp.]|jgi:hypothetical protein|nr:hypothetical protein [Azoarcus sp.]
MSFTDVQNKTTITGFSDADKTTILAAIQTAYEGSATARAMFDDWISAGKIVSPEQPAIACTDTHSVCRFLYPPR